MRGVNVGGERGHLVVVGDIQRPMLPDLRAQGARVGHRQCQAVGVAVGQIELGPWAASRNAVARPMPLAAPVTKHRFPAKYRPDALFAMAVTIPPVSPRPALGTAGPQGVQPQLLEHAHPSVTIAVGSGQNRVAGQHQRGGTRQVRISVGRSSLIGLAVPAFISASTMATICASTTSNCWSSRSRISTSVWRASLQAVTTGSLCS